MRTTAAVPAPKQDLTNQLLARFKDLISERVLQPGMKLPPERELAPKFGVSRSSLRHALKVLETMGVVIQRVGDGTYVTANAGRILSEPLEFLLLLDGISASDVIDTRLIVEPELAARAAHQATAEDLRVMENSLTAMEGAQTVRAIVDADLAFHEAIFRASGNKLCSRLFSLIHRSMADVMEMTTRLVNAEHTLAFHRPILEALDRRRADDARRWMTDHLKDANELLTRAVAAQPVEIPDSAAVTSRKPKLI